MPPDLMLPAAIIRQKEIDQRHKKVVKEVLPRGRWCEDAMFLSLLQQFERVRFTQAMTLSERLHLLPPSN